MVVTATYEDGTTNAVTGYTVSPSGALSLEDTEVTITYQEKTTTQAITVQSDNKSVTSVTVDGVSATEDTNHDWLVSLSSATTSVNEIVVVLEDENATYTLAPDSYDSVEAGQTYASNLRVVAENGSHANYSVRITIESSQE